MGFLCRLFGRKKRKETTKDNYNNPFDPSTSSFDVNRHAIAVATATAAAAEAALAAAHAASEVVRLTNGSAPGASSRTSSAAHVQRRLVEETAAVKIQSAFRGYLARRALRALKALVKLQALVRGHIIRRQSSDMLRRMQTLVRLQTQARASCVHLSTHTHTYKSSHSSYPRCSSNAKFRDTDLERTQFGSNWLESEWNQTRDPPSKHMHQDDEKSDKILEVDTWKPQLSSHHGSSNSFPIAHHYIASDYDNTNIMAYDSPSKYSSEALNPSLSSRKEVASRIYENSPQAFSASSRLGSGLSRGPFTPTKSEFSCGFLSSYSSHPNYMANTESSRAKVRSQSAPRQRLEFERYGSSRSYIQGHCDHPGP